MESAKQYYGYLHCRAKSKQEAKWIGVNKYFTGKHCSRGHLAPRYVSGKCIACSTEDRKKWAKNNPDRVNELAQRYKDKNPDKVKESRRTSARKYAKRNKRKFRLWMINNKGIVSAIQAERRARLINATPCWTTPEDRAEIRRIYKNCPDGSHVDHIYPLKGENVCGLHTPTNLQYLDATLNLQKGNKLIDAEIQSHD